MKTTTRKKIAFLCLSVFCAGVRASEHTVDVTTEVPSEIAIIQADGSALESAFHFNFSAASGVEPLPISFKIISNASNNDLVLNLKEEAHLERQGTTERVLLNVVFNGQQMGTLPIQARGRYVAPYPTVLDGELVISPRTANTRLAVGKYSGTIVLHVANSTNAL